LSLSLNYSLDYNYLVDNERWDYNFEVESLKD
jgi:hypothetical protein